jgi:hypothetical protein
MKTILCISIVTIILLTTLSAFAENNNFTEYDFIGNFIITDPVCSYNHYHGEIILSDNGTGKSKEYINDKEFESFYRDIADKDGYIPLKWSFDEHRKELIIDWTMNGKYEKLAYFKSTVTGDTNNFTINGFSSDNTLCKLNFTRIKGDFTKALPVINLKSQDFAGLFEIKKPEGGNYSGDVILMNDGTGKVREYLDNKPVNPDHPEAIDKDGYSPVKWSYNEETMELTFDWTCGGTYKGLACFNGKVTGNADHFTLSGVWVNGYTGELNFTKIIHDK